MPPIRRTRKHHSPHRAPGLRPASRRLSRRSSARERKITFCPRRRNGKDDVLSGAEVRLSHKWLAGCRPGPYLLRPQNSVGPGRVACLFFVVTSLRPLDKTRDRGSHPASDAHCTCLTTQAYPRPVALACAPRAPARPAASLRLRLRRAFAGAPLSLPRGNDASAGKVQVLTCACYTCVPRCVPPARAVGPVCAVPAPVAALASRSPRLFARSIFACPGRFRISNCPAQDSEAAVTVHR